MKVPFSLAQATSIFPRSNYWYTKGFSLCNSLSRQHNNIQKNTLGTPLTHQNGIRETQISKPLHEKKHVQFFFSKEIQYLGHILSAKGIRPLPAKTHTIQCMQSPTTPKQVRAFLGLVGYYRTFIKGFAKIA